MYSIYEILNKAWNTTTKILFSGEAGELKEYDKWLSAYSYGTK